MKKITLLLMGIGIAFTGFSQVPIYEEGFETGISGWTIDNTTNGSWAHGVPAGPLINSAASGNYSVVTNLTGNYNNNEQSTVTSPSIDITGASGKEKLTMSIWWRGQTSWGGTPDGANISVSYDAGTTWDEIGANGDPNNWYNSATISALTSTASNDGWGNTGPNKWVVAEHALDSAKLVDSASVMLRVNFGSNGSGTRAGFAFDDVRIFAPIRVDLSATVVTTVVKCAYGALEPITVTVRNVGDTAYTPGSIIPINYSVNGGPIVSENIIIIAPLATDSVVDYTFTALADFSVTGTYSLKSWVSYAGDLQTGNDTTTAMVYNSSATLPYFENFEAGQNGWRIDNTSNGSWEFGTPANTNLNSAASGDSAFVTNLTGKYNSNDKGNMFSPCIDITAATGKEVLTMKVQWDSEASYDGANIFSSVDGGTTWSIIGANGDPNNWYNDNSLNGNPNGSSIGWAGDDDDERSAGWVVVQHALDSAMMVDNSTLLLKIGFGSDGSIQYEGFAFDDVAIGLPTATYEYGVAGIDSFSLCLSPYTLDAGVGHPFYNWVDVNENNAEGNWSNTQTLEVTATGTYAITVTNAVGMLATDTVYVKFKDFTPPVLTDVVSCVVGDSAIFDAGSGNIPANYTYTWSTGDTTQTSKLYALGTISVTKTDTALQCSASDTAIFTNEPIFSLREDTAVCEGVSVVLNGGGIIGGHLWSDGSSNLTLSVDTTDVYYLTITDNGGCVKTDSVTITVNALPVVNLGADTALCISESLLLDAGAAASYLWNDASTNQTLAPVVNGDYYVILTDNNGCIGSDTLKVIFETCVGVDEFVSDTEVKMYPNPTKGSLTIKLAKFSNDVTMNILSVYGQVVRTERITSVTTVLDLNDLSEGTYLLQLQTKESTSVSKFMISR